MSLQDWGAVGELISGVAVVLSLVYVAIQLRANTQQVKTQNYDSLTTLFTSFWNSLGTSPQASDVYYRGLTGGELSTEEFQQFRHLMRFQASIYDSIYLQKLQGLYADGERFDQHMRTFRGYVSTPGGLAWWEKEKHHYHPGLVEAVDRIETGLATSE